MKFIYLLPILFTFLSCGDTSIKEVTSSNGEQKDLPLPIDTTEEIKVNVTPKVKTTCDDPKLIYDSNEDVNFEKHPVIRIESNCPTQTISSIKCMIYYNDDSSVKIFKSLNLKPGENKSIPVNYSIKNARIEVLEYYTSDGEHHWASDYQLKEMIKIQEELNKKYPDNGKFK